MKTTNETHTLNNAISDMVLDVMKRARADADNYLLSRFECGQENDRLLYMALCCVKIQTLSKHLLNPKYPKDIAVEEVEKYISDFIANTLLVDTGYSVELNLVKW